MNKKIGHVIGGIALVVFCLIAPASATSAATCHEATGASGCIEVLSWYVSTNESALTVYRLPLNGKYTDTQDNLWWARFTPFCPRNVEGNLWADDTLCLGAINGCGPPYTNAMAMWMVLTPLQIDQKEKKSGPICFAGTGAISVGPQIQALVEDEIGADPPPITLQPQNAIVNLPMISSTEARGPISLAIDDPIAGVAEATPEYLWTFADGAAAHGPGLPYDGTSPTLNPGYYVNYTYHALGTPTVQLAVTWRVTFTPTGSAPVPLDDVVREATATTTVRAAGSELVGD